MATEEDVKSEKTDEAPPEVDTTEAEPRASADLVRHDDGEGSPLIPSDDAPGDEAMAPTQLGAKRYVYAAYFAGAITVAFIASKALEFAWQRFSAWKPQLGEPHGEVIMPIAAVIGALTALYYWRQARTRELAEEVASELSKVTWPNKDEVVQSTAVVIVATLFSTIFFALMDRFWGFLTNLVYGT